MPEFSSDGSSRMGIIGHLEELRKRVLVCLFFLAAASAVFFFAGEGVLAIVTAPVASVTGPLIFIGPAEAFVAYVRMAVTGGVLVSVPLILVQMWFFLSPALPPGMRLRFAGWLGAAAVLFACGILFVYFMALPATLNFLIGFGRRIADPLISLDQYVSFFCALIVIGGLVFEIPVVMVLLADVGLVKPAFLEKKRPHALVLILTVAAMITPTQDVFNMLVFAAPMYLLFEAGLFFSKIITRRHSGER
jgi:sec-independent protein translocase protein TatC